jgi:hypothetical protein
MGELDTGLDRVEQRMIKAGALLGIIGGIAMWPALIIASIERSSFWIYVLLSPFLFGFGVMHLAWRIHFRKRRGIWPGQTEAGKEARRYSLIGRIRWWLGR